MRGNLTEVDFVRLVLRELARTREHPMDSSTGQSILSLHNELVAITGDELDKPRANNVRWTEVCVSQNDLKSPH